MSDYGEKGYLTPDDLPIDSHCRTFKIPNSTQWLSVFMGALLPLIYPESWQQYGNLTPDEAADAALDVIWDAYNNNTCPVDVETPYWDDGTDVDATAPPDDQHWYGELEEVAALSFFSELADDPPELTFLDNLGIWGIAGFIAYAGQPAAAIAFIPFGRKFTLAFKSASAGAIVNVIFDGLHLAQIDTYGVEDQIIEFLVDVGIEPSGEELWVEHSGEHNPEATPDANGEYTIQVVKKQLTPDEFSPTNLRYSVICDCVEQTYDGGDTWVDNPGQDPRHSITYQYPPIGGDDPRCHAAANQVRYLNNVIDGALGNIALFGDALSLALFLLPFLIELGPFYVLFDVVLSFAGTLIAAGATALGAAFTNEVYDQLTCIFYCNIEADGTVTAADVTLIESQVGTDIGGLVQVVVDAMLFLTGEVGMSNQGTIGDAPADCDDCACDWCWDAAADGTWDGWQSLPWASGSAATWNGTQWDHGTSGDDRVYLVALLYVFSTPVTLTQIIASHPVGYPYATLQYNLTDTSVWWDVSSGGTSFPGQSSGGWDGEQEVNNIVIYTYTVDTHEDVTISDVLLRGRDDNPFGMDNC